MKLLLTAALLFCGPSVGLAEITLSGQAAMGLVHETGKIQSVSDMQLTLHASRVTDGGVEFGAVLDLDQSPSRAFRHNPPRAYVYMSTGNFVVRTGNAVPSAAPNSAPNSGPNRSAFGF